MIAKIKSYASYILSLAVLILSALFYAQKRKTENAQSELAHEKSSTEIKWNEKDRQAARDHANDLLDNYERLERDE